MAQKRDNTGLYLLILLFFFLRLYGGKKKGIGTTLFGVGTQLDLTKPIEDIDAFIQASKEENERGYEGLIQPKGIYYLLPAGSKVFEKNIVDKTTNCPADVIAEKEKVIYRTYSSEDRKIYNPKLAYLDEGDNSKFLPPYVIWNAPGLTFFVLPDCGGSIVDTRYSTAERADYGNFYRIPEKN